MNKVIRSHLLKYWKQIGISFVFSLISVSLLYLFPYLDMLIYNNLTVSDVTGLILVIALTVFTVLIVKSIMEIFNEYLLTDIRGSFTNNLRLYFTNRVLNSKYNILKGEDSGQIIQKTIDEVDNFGENAKDIFTLIVSLLQIFGIFLIVLTINRTLPIIFVIYSFIYLIWDFIFFNIHVRKQSKLSDKSGDLYTIVHDIYNSYKLVKQYSLYSRTQDKIESHHINVYGISKDLARVYFLTALKEHLHVIMLIIGILVLIPLINSGVLERGNFALYIGVLELLGYPLREVSKGLTTIKNNKVCISRLQSLYDLEQENTNGKILHEEIESIVFKNVSFSYEDSFVLQNLNLEINRSENIAIIGRSGSGKSTIAKLLLQLYDSYYGDILINGSSIKEYNLEILRNKIGLLSQEPFLFNDSISFNLNPLDENNVKDHSSILKKCKMDKFINKLEFEIGENGEYLSSGEKQRLALGRLFLKDCEVVIFDEPTSNLDPETEAYVNEYMRQMYKNPNIITITITHKENILAAMDKIFVVQNGLIAEEGIYETLQSFNGYFSDIFSKN